MLRVLDLFSGIGGFSLGLERTRGFKTVAFCEIESFPRAVLAKHWPEVPCYEDVRTLTAERLRADGISVDVICGGFPCQDISVAGRGAGLAGERSGLWSDYARLIGEVRPRWVIVENVAILRARGLEDVLGALDALGYDAEWHCISAGSIGAPHRRDRLWVVAHPNDERGRGVWTQREADCRDTDAGGNGAGKQMAARLANSTSGGRREHGNVGQADDEPRARQPSDSGADVSGRLISAADIDRVYARAIWPRAKPRLDRKIDGIPGSMDGGRPVEPWEGNTARVVERGYPNRRPRLKAIGNSVVPQIPELIGRAIMAAERAAI